MSHKKPIWTTTEAHKRLKEYCKASGRTQLEVVSNLILTNLDPAKPDSQSAPASPAKKATGKSGDIPTGVWVV